MSTRNVIESYFKHLERRRLIDSLGIYFDTAAFPK
jgi:hypothetical protein